MPRRLTLLPAFCHISWAEATAEGQIGGSASAMSAVLQLWGQQQNLMFATSNILFSFRSLKIAIDLQNEIIKVHWPVSCSPTCVSCLVYVGLIVCLVFPFVCFSTDDLPTHTHCADRGWKKKQWTEKCWVKPTWDSLCLNKGTKHVASSIIESSS